MQWNPALLASATGGRQVGPQAPGTALNGVSIDSRAVAAGAVFVPIRADRDGHDFVQDAVQRGAGAYLFEAGRLVVLPSGAVAIEVADTSHALLDIGRAARQRLSGPVVGITGSVGKTSTKDMAAAVLRARLVVAASERSFNNELGVPLTLANASDDTEVAVIEMGARGPGHIRLLCDIAQPTVGVVTAVAAVHTEMFGSVDAVAVAKGELVESLPTSGTAILNGDDHRVAAMAERTSATVVRYSADGVPGAEVVARQVRLDDDLRPRFALRSPWGDAEVHLAARGVHQVGNALAAATVGFTCGVPADAVAEALGQAGLSAWRMQLDRTVGGGAVLNDAYNANPTSMAASLRALAAFPASRRIAVLGEMAELGGTSGEDHARMAEIAESLGIAVIAVGTTAYGIEPVDGVEAAVAAVQDRLGRREVGPGDAVLVKASRVAGLERVAAALIESSGGVAEAASR